MSLSFAGNTFFAILLSVAAATLAVLFYRYTLPPLMPRRRFILSLLRAGVLVFLVLLLFEPLVRIVNHHNQPAAVAVLLDASQSMGMIDGAGDRAETIKQLLSEKPFANIPSSATIEYFLFSSKLSLPTPTPPDSIAVTGEATNLSDALEGIKNRIVKDNIRSVVLISDGNYTSGKSPTYVADAMEIPIFSVGIGDTAEQKDIVVKEVQTNSITLAGTKVPVDITIKSSGYAGEAVDVQLQEGSTTLDHQVLTMRDGTHEYPVKLYVEPKTEGMRRYTVVGSRLPGELTEKNNVRSFFMKVLKSKVRIVLFAGAPSPDVSAVVQTLSAEQQFSVRSIVQWAQNELYGGPLSRSLVDSADCVVFVGFPSAATSNASMQQIAEVMTERKKPLLFIGGKNIDYAKLQLIESMLPFGWSSITQSEVEVFPSVAERQKNNPLITFDGTLSAEAWHNLPPIFRTQTSIHAKAESNILVSMNVQNIVVPDPLLLVRSIARQKSFVITGHGIWRWGLMAQGNPATERFLPLLLTNAVRWLTTSEDEKRVRIVPAKETFTTTEPIEFTGQVYDEQLRPLDNANVIVTLNHGNEKISLALTPVGNGRYDGSLDGVVQGDYTYAGTATLGGTSLGEDDGRISVGQVNFEFLQTKMDKSLLEQLAFRSGGRYFSSSATKDLADTIAARIDFTPKERILTSEIELWNWRYVAAMLIVLLACEWFLRKRTGML